MAAQVTESDQIKQFKEFLGTYNKLTENCFMDCVKDFTTREVKPEEPKTGYSLKPSKAEPGQYLDERPNGKTELLLEVVLERPAGGAQPVVCTTCSESCLQKYLKMTQRISMRFQEYHIQQNEALAAKAGLLAQPR